MPVEEKKKKKRNCSLVNHREFVFLCLFYSNHPKFFSFQNEISAQNFRVIDEKSTYIRLLMSRMHWLCGAVFHPFIGILRVIQNLFFLRYIKSNVRRFIISFNSCGLFRINRHLFLSLYMTQLCLLCFFFSNEFHWMHTPIRRNDSILNHQGLCHQKSCRW